MNLLVINELSAETLAGLRALGLAVDYAPDIEAHALADRISDAQLLVAGKTRINRRAIEAGKKLQAILRAGVGVDTIDLQAASERGIIVSDCADADAHARAEHALALLLALDRGLHGKPNSALGLRGRTLGLHGWDASAAALAHAAQGLGMRVLVSSRRLTSTLAAEAGVHWSDSPDGLYRRADVISVHPETPGELLATAERIASLPDHATLIDVAGRGHIDLAAAHARLAANTLRLGLDGYDANDYGDDVPFAADLGPNLLATFRQAGRTRQVEDAIGHQVVSALESFLRARTIPGTRNLDETRGGPSLLIRHLPGPEVLAAVFEVLKDAECAVTRVSSRNFEGGRAALLSVGLATAPGSSVRAELSTLAGVLGVEVEG